MSSGASLGVAIFLLAGAYLPVAFVQSGWGLICSATIGAILVLLLVLAVSARVKQSVSLLIVGIMFGQIAGSFVTILQNASNPDSLKLFVIWTFGSLSAVTWDYMAAMLPIVVAGLILVYIIQKPLDAFLLGENYALSLGVNVQRVRFLIIVAVALLAGATTAFTGFDSLYRNSSAPPGARHTANIEPRHKYNRVYIGRRVAVADMRHSVPVACRRLLTPHQRHQRIGRRTDYYMDNTEEQVDCYTGHSCKNKNSTFAKL